MKKILNWKIGGKLFVHQDRVPIRPAEHFLYFAFCGYFANVFAKHTMKYKTLTVHLSYFMRISCFINAVKK